MKIDCLMGTYGRYALVCESLASFLQQSAISHATLLIYNQHPEPLIFDHPRVRVVNEPAPHASLRHIRRRMHDLADPAANLIHWWDDDDLYLPWHLQDCLDNIGDGVAWKPASSWFSEANLRFTLSRNRFEGSWVFHSDYVRVAPLHTHPEYTDHPVILQTEEAGLISTTELGDLSSYIYRWGIGTQHLSQYGSGDEQQQAGNVDTWRARSTDIEPGGVLLPSDLSLRWHQYLNGIRNQIKPESMRLIEARLSRLLY